jgi:hypothetical protein
MSAGSDKIEVLLDSFAKQQRTNDVLTQKVKIAKMKLEKEKWVILCRSALKPKLLLLHF